jgi:hypothetical protein
MTKGTRERERERQIARGRVSKRKSMEPSSTDDCSVFRMHGATTLSHTRHREIARGVSITKRIREHM